MSVHFDSFLSTIGVFRIIALLAAFVCCRLYTTLKKQYFDYSYPYMSVLRVAGLLLLYLGLYQKEGYSWVTFIDVIPFLAGVAIWSFTGALHQAGYHGKPLQKKLIILWAVDVAAFFLVLVGLCGFNV